MSGTSKELEATIEQYFTEEGAAKLQEARDMARIAHLAIEMIANSLPKEKKKILMMGVEAFSEATTRGHMILSDEVDQLPDDVRDRVKTLLRDYEEESKKMDSGSDESSTESVGSKHNG